MVDILRGDSTTHHIAHAGHVGAGKHGGAGNGHRVRAQYATQTAETGAACGQAGVAIVCFGDAAGTCQGQGRRCDVGRACTLRGDGVVACIRAADGFGQRHDFSGAHVLGVKQTSGAHSDHIARNHATALKCAAHASHTDGGRSCRVVHLVADRDARDGQRLGRDRSGSGQGAGHAQAVVAGQACAVGQAQTGDVHRFVQARVLVRKTGGRRAAQGQGFSTYQARQGAAAGKGGGRCAVINLVTHHQARQAQHLGGDGCGAGARGHGHVGQAVVGGFASFGAVGQLVADGVSLVAARIGIRELSYGCDAQGLGAQVAGHSASRVDGGDGVAVIDLVVHRGG